MSNRSDLSQIQLKLVPWLQKKMPQAQNLSISNIRKAERGFSTDTFHFDLSWREAGQHRSQGMVCRRLPEMPLFPDYDLRRQFLVMERLQGTNILVPKVYWLEREETVMGEPFYVMGEIKGVTASDYPVYHSHGVYFDANVAQRAKMWWGCVETIAKIHTLDWKSLGLSFLAAPKYGAGPLDQVLNYYEVCLNWAKEEPQPILETAMAWLKKNRYSPDHITLCWGDSRMSNILYSPDFEVAAVLDWETAYLGDHEADLAWMLFLDWTNSEAAGVPRLEGTPSREETVRRYEELTGWKVSRLLYNEVLAAFLLSVPMLTVYKRMRKAGFPIGDDVELNNICTQRLAELLNLEPPGPGGGMMRDKDATVKAQFHLTGPMARDWYVISDKGDVSSEEGVVKDPDVTLTVSAEDWEAMQKGELNRAQAFMDGKIKAEGNFGLLMQLEDILSRLDRTN